MSALGSRVQISHTQSEMIKSKVGVRRQKKNSVRMNTSLSTVSLGLVKSGSGSLDCCSTKMKLMINEYSCVNSETHSSGAGEVRPPAGRRENLYTHPNTHTHTQASLTDGVVEDSAQDGDVLLTHDKVPWVASPKITLTDRFQCTVSTANQFLLFRPVMCRLPSLFFSSSFYTFLYTSNCVFHCSFSQHKSKNSKISTK